MMLPWKLHPGNVPRKKGDRPRFSSFKRKKGDKGKRGTDHVFLPLKGKRGQHPGWGLFMSIITIYFVVGLFPLLPHST